MTDGLKWTVNHVPGSDDKFLDLMSEENVTKANEFHKSFPPVLRNTTAEAFRSCFLSWSKGHLLQR